MELRGRGRVEEYLVFFFFFNYSEVKKHAFDPACQVLVGNDSRMEKYRTSELTREREDYMEKKENMHKRDTIK